MGWKWLGDKKVNIRSQPDYTSYKPGTVDDKDLVTDLWKVLDEADVLIAHNGDAFDLKILNARFVANGLNAPSAYKTVDTLKVAKKYFKFNNNSLNELGQYLQEGKKAPTGGFETWTKCMAGDKEAWNRMTKYNIQDVELLERVYLRLRPFMEAHPNLNTIAPPKTKTTEFACQTCQSTNTTKRGFAVTKMGRYQRFQCNSCGSWSSGSYERGSRSNVGYEE
jgi:DNA polymerase elongation subunit (family B)